MKLVINLKLLPTPDQYATLMATLERANSACNYTAEFAYSQGVFGQFALHRLTYYNLREKFGLAAQIAVRAIAKVADSYKLDHKNQRFFRAHGAFPYDSRILRYLPNDSISIWTLSGRKTITFECGDYQRKLLPFRQGESDLLLVNNVFYLNAICDVDEPELINTTDVLGVDLGIVNIAVDSNGMVYSGKSIEKHRRIQSHRKRNLQRKGTHAAYRKLKRISGKQKRFQKHTNHVISKAIVRSAKATNCAIGLEDLMGIRNRVTARRSQRARLGNWAFFQQRSFIQYKAKLSGVPVILVDPRNTSRTCPECGYIAKANRRSQSEFICGSCGFAGLADHIAARNIRARAVVNQPMFPVSA